jgi:hypothetical protein
MKERGSYTTDIAEIRRRVDGAGLSDIFAARSGLNSRRMARAA